MLVSKRWLQIEDLNTSIFYFNNIIQINIIKPISYKILIEELKIKLSKEDFQYVKIHQLSNKLIDGKLIIIKGIPEFFNIIVNKNYCFLLKNIVHLDKIRQVSLLNKIESNFIITEKIMTFQEKSSFRKFDSNETRKIFPRNDALSIVYELLKDLNSIKDLNDIIELDLSLNLIKNNIKVNNI